MQLRHWPHVALLIVGLAALPACRSSPRPCSIASPQPLPPVTPIAEQSIDPAETDAEPEFLTPERLDAGYTIVVTGVSGDNGLTAGLAPGIALGGYGGAVEVIDWTTGFWPLFVFHLRSEAHHTKGARAVVERVAAYRRRYPGRELNLVGYSAGADVVLEALESLPDDQTVDRVVLLAGAVSPAHDLRPALRRVRIGMWNYYQPQDVVALWAGTLVAGTADGHHLMSAGAVGFWPRTDYTLADRELIAARMIPLPYEPRMAQSGNLGGHFQCVNQQFVTDWITPILNGQQTTSERLPAERQATHLAY